MTLSAPTQDQIEDQASEEEILRAGESVYVAPPWKLMWWRFRKHKMAMVSAAVLIVFYFVAVFCEFVAPYDPDAFFNQYKYSPPTAIHFRDAQGQFHAPFIYQATRGINPVTALPTYTEDMQTRYPIRGSSTSCWGLFLRSFICSAYLPRGRSRRCFCSARTAWVATCFPGSPTAHACRSPWAWSVFSSA